MKTSDYVIIGILIYLLWPKQTGTSVNIPGVNQVCYDFAGNPYEIPVSLGPCPTA